MFFFFSSRRRHTRWTGDWSSDVCSSDLDELRATIRNHALDHSVFRAAHLPRALECRPRVGERFFPVVDHVLVILLRGEDSLCAKRVRRAQALCAKRVCRAQSPPAVTNSILRTRTVTVT